MGCGTTEAHHRRAVARTSRAGASGGAAEVATCVRRRAGVREKEIGVTLAARARRRQGGTVPTPAADCSRAGHAPPCRQSFCVPHARAPTARQEEHVHLRPGAKFERVRRGGRMRERPGRRRSTAGGRRFAPAPSLCCAGWESSHRSSDIIDKGARGAADARSPSPRRWLSCRWRARAHSREGVRRRSARASGSLASARWGRPCAACAQHVRARCSSPAYRQDDRVMGLQMSHRGGRGVGAGAPCGNSAIPRGARWWKLAC